MPRPKTQNPEVRQRIFQAAERIFADNEYASASIRAIAEAAGVTVPMIYYYFGNKEGLFRALVAEGVSDFGSLLKRHQAKGGTTREQLVEVVWAFFSFCNRDTGLVKLVNRMMAGADNAAPQLDYWEGFRTGYEAVCGILTTGQDNQELAQYGVAEMALAVVGTVGEHVRMHLWAKSAVLDHGLAERIVDMLFRGIVRAES